MMIPATKAALEAALSDGLSSIFTDDAVPADPIRALAHQLLDIADGKAGSEPTSQRPVPARVLLDGREQHEADDTESWSISKFVKSLPLEHHIASAIRVPPGVEQFEFCKRLTKFELLERLREARLEGLVDPLWHGLSALGAQAAATGHELSQKFAMEGITMALGGLSAFSNGLEALIGPALLARGDDGKKSLMNQMRIEHHDPRDSGPFESANGVLTTSPVEWEFARDPQPGKAYPERYDHKDDESIRLRNQRPEHCRRPRAFVDLQAEAADRNVRLAEGGFTLLVDEELVGGRLYTGTLAMARPVSVPPSLYRYR